MASRNSEDKVLTGQLQFDIIQFRKGGIGMATVSIDKALANAIASVKIEGYKFTSYQEQLCRDVVTGKLSKQDCIKRLLAEGAR